MTSFFRDLWALIGPYWKSEERWIAAALLGASIALDAGLTAIGVGFNSWNQALFNAIQDRDLDEFLHQLAVWGMLFVALLLIVTHTYYFSQLLRLRWRRWMTRHWVETWLERQSYYRLQLEQGGSDNPDQRIAEDIALFVDKSVELFLGFLHAFMGLAAFATILWRLSDNFQFLGIAIPGFLLWAALAYAATATWLADLIGRKLIALNFLHQRFEADFRFSLVRVRENAQSIALIGGEAEEAGELNGHFRHVVSNWREIISRQRNLIFVQRGRQQFSGIFAYIIMAPGFFTGNLRLGDLMQAQSGFVQFEMSLSWLVSNYRELAAWKATMNRLSGFHAAIQATAADEATQTRCQTGEEAIALRDVTLRRPDGKELVTGLSLLLPKGCRLLITGPSGCGKSTLFNAIAGIWPYTDGTMTVPANARLLFLPQRPYLPITRLSQAIAYPEPAETFGHARIAAALERCGLGALADQLDVEDDWNRRLSPGEQQRLAFARALLIQPDFLFLDEATSALDETSESILYRLLLAELPGSGIVSIAHRSTVKAFHRHQVDLTASDADTSHVQSVTADGMG